MVSANVALATKVGGVEEDSGVEEARVADGWSGQQIDS